MTAGMESQSRAVLDPLAFDGRVMIRLNHQLISGACVLCGTHCDSTGIDPFIGDGRICAGCAERRAPGLLAETRARLAAIATAFLCQQPGCPLRDEAERAGQRETFDRMQRRLTHGGDETPQSP